MVRPATEMGKGDRGCKKDNRRVIDEYGVLEGGLDGANLVAL